jgi:hypothetical protein
MILLVKGRALVSKWAELLSLLVIMDFPYNKLVKP